jgi:hypothetical protein
MDPKKKIEEQEQLLATENGLSPVLIQFKEALLNKDIGLLEKLLHNQYTYLDGLNKKETLEWFGQQFALEIPEICYQADAQYSVCMACRPGRPVLFFHCGSWPSVKEHPYPKSIRVDIENDLICDLSLCFNFCYPAKLQNFTKNN